jgi:hypothetical protein
LADISDVENALVAAITAAVYPTGTSNPSSIGVSARIYRGWPNARALDADLAANIVNISVFPQGGMTRNTTRFPLDYVDTTLPTPTITVSTAGQVVTFAGAAGAGNLCGIRAAGIGYAYAAAPTDTPSAVAAALAAQIPGASATGPAVTTTGSWDTLGRIVSIGTSTQETRRQVQGFMITCWCPGAVPPAQIGAIRDTAASVVDAALAPIEFLPLADGTGGRLLYHNTRLDDAPTKDALWRRDLFYSVEYPTTRLLVAAEMLWGIGTISPQAVVPGNPVVSTVNIIPA